MIPREIKFAQVEAILDRTPDDKKAPVTCALIGHSRFVEGGFGYLHCARCGDQVADTLLSAPDENFVAATCDCKTCRENIKDYTWQDFYLVPDHLILGKRIEP